MFDFTGGLAVDGWNIWVGGPTGASPGVYYPTTNGQVPAVYQVPYQQQQQNQQLMMIGLLVVAYLIFSKN